MKIKSSSENGNVDLSNDNRNNIYSENTLNRDWSEDTRSQTSFIQSSEHITDNNRFTNVDTINDCVESESENHLVCNEQFKINNNIIKKLDKFKTDADYTLRGNIKELNSPDFLIINDDTSTLRYHTNKTERLKAVPRGIVNPNYPGFQHLADTLQDYSSRIENFYNSDNEMTDDDIDLELGTDVTVDTDDPDVTSNNNSIDIDQYNLKNINLSKNLNSSKSVVQNEIISDIPDLLRSIKNDKSTVYRDLGTDADIENNFYKSEIIGDFNKEIEDEIKCVLNYNINIQNDLAELKKDIQDNFSKPIENTINNISDVVNHVIRKLVETQTNIHEIENSSNISIEPIINGADDSQKFSLDMNVSRPTFLHIENNLNDRLNDAFLSDCTDEINTNDKNYDDACHSNENLENTLKELGELHSIPPDIHVEDKENISSPNLCVSRTDGNSNQISPPILSYNVKEYDTTRKTKSKRRYDVTNSEVLRSGASCSSGRNYLSVRNSESNDSEVTESFDVYNIETALPKLDLDALESHLRSAKEAERRVNEVIPMDKRNDREEIRKRLAMGAECDEYYSMGHIERPEKKPSLQSRLQSGRNLQICFMNDAASDTESQTSDFDKSVDKKLSKSSIFSKSNYNLSNHPYHTRPLSVNISKQDKITTLQTGGKLKPSVLSSRGKSRSAQSLGPIDLKESDFYALQSTLQTEARIALAQAKEMARIQMERERRSRPLSPVTEMLRRAMQKANAPLATDRRRVSRHLLTDMNVAQLQVIVNELHSEIETLNEGLVCLLMARDELHMGQDSMLVDIEDLTRYLGIKEQSKKTKGKSAVRRFTSLVQNK